MTLEIDLHGRRTAWLTHRLCTVLGIARQEACDWAIAALTHDIGKLDVPQVLLGKAGALTGEERCIVERHCIAGAKRLIARAGPDDENSTTAAIAVALSHHEWWNGAGYPFGLTGSAIPICARVVAVADVLDALTSARVYKAAWRLDEALSHVAAQRALQFDPDCADAMQVVARSLSENWQAEAQEWGRQLTEEAGRVGRVAVNAR
ncbi:MAG: HD domain-containing phosphohydrolase [Betaproteobacteria bacterium]